MAGCPSGSVATRGRTVCVVGASGLRVLSLILSAAVKDRRLAVNPAEGIVWGTPKTHQQRSVPLPRFLIAELEEAIHGKGRNDLVFSSPHGLVLRNHTFRRNSFDSAAESVGLPGLTPHERAAHGSQSRSGGRRERKSGAADARPRERGNDARCPLGSVRGRPGRAGRSDRRRASSCGLVADRGRCGGAERSVVPSTRRPESGDRVMVGRVGLEPTTKGL